MRAVQSAWADTSVRERLACLRRARRRLASRSGQLAECIARPAAQTLTSEVIPLLEALRFLEREADQILAPRRMPADGQPMWLRSVALEIHREPFGIVLVIGPGNYPLMLPAVHTAQALAAGNAVIVKPGRGGRRALLLFVESLIHGGVPPGLVQLLGEDPEEARESIEAGCDKVVFTGSNAVGLQVLSQTARHGIPCVMELSGYDPVFVRKGADPDVVIRALRFGATLNRGETCIAPKQVFASAEMAEVLRERLAAEAVTLPVIAVQNDDEALRLASASGYALGATVFGDEAEARSFARRIRAGTVVINDMIVPTADPRLPFSGRGKSGFGVTRGAEGLLEMTTVKAVAVRRSRWLPHLDPVNLEDGRMYERYIEWSHGTTWTERLRGLRDFLRAAVKAGKGK